MCFGNEQKDVFMKKIPILLSEKELYRVGLFAAYSYKKPPEKVPSLSPFAAFKLGTWLIETHVRYRFAFQFDVGLEWKFR